MGGKIQATVTGYLNKKPELRRTQGGQSVLNIEIGTGQSHKDEQTNSYVNDTEPVWVKAAVWGEEAEYIAKIADKGSFVMMTGELVKKPYQSDKGNGFEYSLEFPAVRVNKPKDNNGGGNQGNGNGGFGGQPQGNQGGFNQGNQNQSNGGFNNGGQQQGQGGFGGNQGQQNQQGGFNNGGQQQGGFDQSQGQQGFGGNQGGFNNGGQGGFGGQAQGGFGGGNI